MPEEKPSPLNTVAPPLKVVRNGGYTNRHHYSIRCGCCDEKVTICNMDPCLEIGGVCATKAEWKRVLAPFFRTIRPAKKKAAKP